MTDKKLKLVYQRKLKAFELDTYADVAMMETPLSTIQIFPRTGEFFTHHQEADGFTLTKEMFDEMVDNFHDKAIRSSIPVYAGHGEMGGNDRPAVGWVKDLINKGDSGLWAVVEWNYEGRSLVRDKKYMYISPEWFFDYQEPETGDTFSNVVSAIALVNEPYFSENAPVVASERDHYSIKILNNEAIMDLNELRKKSAADLTEAERAFLVEHKAELTEDEQKALLPEAKQEDKKEDNEQPAEKKEDAPAGDKPDGDNDAEKDKAEADKAETPAGDKPADGEGQKPVEAHREQSIKITAARHAELLAKEQKLEATEQKLAAAEVDTALDECKMVPAAKTLASKFALSLKASQRAEFYDVLKAHVQLKTDRKTSAEDQSVSKETMIKNRASELMQADSKLNFSDAVRKARKEVNAKK